MSELNDFLSLIAEAKRNDPKFQKVKQIEKQVSESVKSDLGSLFAQLASIQKRVETLPEETEGKAQAQQIIAEVMLEPEAPVVVPEEVKEETGVDMDEVGKYLTGKTFQQPNPEPPSRDVDDIRQKIKFLEQWLGKIAAHGPGSGEVNFRYLDDVNRSTMNPGNDNWVLEYDAATKKAQFTKDIGPIESVYYDPTHIDDHAQEGVTCWNADDYTLNIHHKNGVIQQVGQEQYYLARNQTGNSIPNGTVVMFSGAIDNEQGQRLLMAPFVADGTYPTLYVMGVTTQDVANGENGFVTSFGKVRDVNTSSWNQGDILYANPLVPGGMTNIKPTAPNNVVPVAAVLNSDANGEIFVRPTIEQKQLYARFSSITDQFPLAIETPYPIVFGITDIARGFHADGEVIPDYSKIYAEDSGFYKFDATLSLTSTNSSAKAFYVWMRKNGVDIPRSAKRQSVQGNGTYQILAYTFSTSLNKDDYIQIMYAVSDITISINAPDATAFCPAVPSATLVCVQIAL